MSLLKPRNSLKSGRKKKKKAFKKKKHKSLKVKTKFHCHVYIAKKALDQCCAASVLAGWAGALLSDTLPRHCAGTADGLTNSG